MRKSVLAIVVAMAPAAALPGIALPDIALAAGLSDLPKLDQTVAPSRQIPVKRDSAVNSCAAYGPGFVKVAGSDTCVKLGGAVRIDAVGSR